MIKKKKLVILTCVRITNINMERLEDVNYVEATRSLKVYIIWTIHEFSR